MSETQTVVPSQENAYTAESITDEVLAGYLAGFGNSEGKSLLIIAMAEHPEGTWYGEADLHNLLRSAAPGVDMGRRRNQIGWCQQSLEPVGMVAKQRSVDGTSYELTQEGREEGAPLAAFLLDVAERHNVSLYRVFGATQASKTDNRAAQVRLKTMRHFVDKGGVVTIDSLEEALGSASKGALFTTLRALDSANLIGYESWDPEKNVNSYRAVKTDYNQRKDASEISRMLKSYFAQTKEATLDQVMAYVADQRPAEFTGDATQDRDLVARSLKSMARRGQLESVDYKQAKEYVEIELSDEQLTFWIELLDGLERFQTRDPAFMNHYRQRAHEILRDPEACKRAIKTYIENSPHALQGQTTKDSKSIILGVLAERPDGLSARQAIEELKASNRRTLSLFGARQALNKLVETGTAELIPGKVNTYRLLKDESEDSHTQVRSDVESERVG